MYGHTTVVNQPNMSKRMQGNVDGLVEEALDEAKEQREDEKLDAFRQQYEEKYGKKEFDWSRVMSSIMLGGLLGGLLATLLYNTDAKSSKYYFFGVFLGSVGFGGFMYIFLVIKEMKDPYKEDQARRKEAKRRMEAEKLQDHDEFVYYDSARGHSSAFRCLCCPHDGKITSERILYSAQQPFPILECTCRDANKNLSCRALTKSLVRFPAWLCEVIGWPWSKRKEMIDIDHVTDVTVDQSCTEFCLDVGTVVIHCHANADESMIKEMREKLIHAIKTKNEETLQRALLITKTMKDEEEIRDIYEAANQTLGQVQADMKERGETLQNFVSAGDENNPGQIRVLSVAHPQAILDDLSYKLCKDRKAGRQ